MLYREFSNLKIKYRKNLISELNPNAVIHFRVFGLTKNIYNTVKHVLLRRPCYSIV